VAESWRGGYSHNLHATVDPTVVNDLTQGYSQGSVWVNQASGKAWVCVADSPVGSASWSLLSTMAVTGIASTINQSGGVIPAGVLNGGCDNIIISVNPSPGLLTTRTASQMFADLSGAVINQSFQARIINKGLTNLWLGGGQGVTLNGCGAIKPGRWMDLIGVFTSASSLIMTMTAEGASQNNSTELTQAWRSLASGLPQLQPL
jgi:hypothetical protein